MLQLSTFTLTDNFARRTYNFYDDKLIQKIKSLTVEAEFETKYEDIRAITYKKMISINWLWKMMWLSGAILLLNLTLLLRGIDLSTVIEIEKGLIITGLILGIIDSRKKEYCSFQDKNRQYLVTIRVTKKNRTLLAKAIELIKQKTNLFSERHPNDPLPSVSPVLDVVHYDIPDFLNRSFLMFFEDKMVEVNVSLLEETATEVNFHELSGKTKLIKTGNNSWEDHWCLGLAIMPIVYVIVDLFSQYSLSIYIFMAGVFLPMLLSLLKYIKQEYLIFYNNNDKALFWIKRTKRDRAKVDQIEMYIQQRVLEMKGLP